MNEEWPDNLSRWIADLDNRLKDIERRMTKVEEIAFAVQAEWTTKKVDKWAKENLDAR